MKSTKKSRPASGDIKDLASAFEEATSITIGLVAFPVILLLLGVFLDKTFSTTPLFIFLGIISGVGAGIFRAYQISKKYSLKIKKVKKEKNG